jgi:hypothetical protein
MRRGFYMSVSAALPLVFLSWPRAISAQEGEGPVASQAQSEQAKSLSPELAPLPAQLTDEQARALQQLPPAVPRRSARYRRPGFYRGAYNRPLTPHEVALRESVYELATRRKQFVHVRLVDGKVLTGTIDFTSAEAFLLKTDLFGSGRLVHYRQLAEPPRPVLAVGTKTVRGLEVTGLVVACIVLLPVAVAMYPLIAAGVIQD